MDYAGVIAPYLTGPLTTRTEVSFYCGRRRERFEIRLYDRDWLQERATSHKL